MDSIKKLTNEDKQRMLAKSFFTLPDNPSDKGFSASQIKKKGYEGLLVLYDLLSKVVDDVDGTIDDIVNGNTTIQAVLEKAVKDSDGNVIKTTYETKTMSQERYEQLSEALRLLTGNVYTTTEIDNFIATINGKLDFATVEEINDLFL